MSSTVSRKKTSQVDHLHSQVTKVRTAPESASEPAKSTNSNRGKIALFACGGLLLVAGTVAIYLLAIYLLNNSSADESSNLEIEKLKAAAEKKSSDNAAAIAKRDEQLRTAIVGKWELLTEGKKHLTLNADNTGKFDYWPDWKNTLALTSNRLEIQFKWSLKNGHVDMQSISGTPERAFKIATLDRGKRKYYHIRSLTSDELVLYELKTKDVDHWKRVE